MSFRKTTKIKTRNAGFGLVEVMISVGISGILLMAMISMFQSQQREVKSLRQKQDIIDLKSLMQAQLSKTEVCTWQLKGKSIDMSSSPTAATPSATVLDLDVLLQGTDPSSAVIAKATEPLANSSVIVESVSFKGIYPTGNPDEYIGHFEVSFDARSLAYSIRPVVMSQIIKTEAGAPGSIKVIEACGKAASSEEEFSEEDLNSVTGFDIHCRYRWVTSNGYGGGPASFVATLVTSQMLWWRERDYSSTIIYRTNKRQATGQYSGVITKIYKSCP